MEYLKILFVFLYIWISRPLLSQEVRLTLVHSNDLHSHLMPSGPEIDFGTNVDKTIGGWSRIATKIKEIRGNRFNPVFVLDAGDFTMGTLFHVLTREEAFELRLMKKMGYDIIALGNHEFDLRPKGLAKMINSAREKGGLPEIVFSNALFNNESEEDNSLEKIFKHRLIKPYSIREIDQLRIGFFGVLGKSAAKNAPFAHPVRFKDPIQTAREMVRILREKERVDIVVCLSHGGLNPRKMSGEDIDLARKVPGINIIVSGHSHTSLPQPIIINDTIIVQADEHGKSLGVIDLLWNGKNLLLQNYSLEKIDHTIVADAFIESRISSFITKIEKKFLKKYGLGYSKIVGKTDFDLLMFEGESPLGNLISDSIRWYVNKHDFDPNDPMTKVRVAIEANGLIRSNLLKGATGNLSIADIFKTIPLGIGMDNTIGYPLVTCYLYASEIKKALEITTSIYPIKGESYFLQVSGIKFAYNPYRAIFDRVTDILIEIEENIYVPLDYSSSNKTLYRVAANLYIANFVKKIKNFTHGLLNIIPKNRFGEPIEDFSDHILSATDKHDNFEELKEWLGVIEYIKSFNDLTRDGTLKIPQKYQAPLGRIVKKPSLNPINLLSRGTYITWFFFLVAIITLLTISAIILFLMRKILKSLKKSTN